MNTYLYNGHVVTASSKSEVLAFNKDRISDEVKEAYEALNERYTDYHGKINEKELSDSIRRFVENTAKHEARLGNKRVSTTSIVWYGLYGLFKEYLEWYECSKTDLSNEQIKNWFAYNGTDYKNALKQAINNINNVRKDEYFNK